MLPNAVATLYEDCTAYQRRTVARSLRWWQVKSRPPLPAELQLAPTPAETVYTVNKCRLLHYTNSERDDALRKPLLLVPSIINRYYIMDLQPGRSLVAYLLQQGFDVWAVDWGAPGPEDRFDAFDDYVVTYLRRLVQRVRRATGGEPVSLLGYCIGGIFTAIYAALYPHDVANLINLAGPIDFSDDGLLCAWTRPDRFRPQAIVGAYGNMPGWLMNGAFDNAIPGNWLRQELSLWERLDNEARLQDYLGLQYWLRDEVDFPGAAYKKYIQALYQENRLAQGTLEIGGRLVNLANIGAPLLSITATQDHIAPSPSVLILNDLVSSADKETVVIEGGHIGIVAGRNAKENLWPKLAVWLRPRSG